MIIKIHVEGQSEEGFVNIILTPYLMELGYQMVSPIKNETSTGHRGGLSHYDQFRKNTRRLCGSSQCLITTMIDFYKLPNDFPGMDDMESIQNDKDKVEHLEQELKNDVSIQAPNYFIPYIQLHEFEALLFSDITKIDDVLKKGSCSYKKELNEIMNTYHEPENINTNEGPSVKLIKITNGTYLKKIHGLMIAERITLEIIREKCPHFNDWLKQLEDFAKEHC